MVDVVGRAIIKVTSELDKRSSDKAASQFSRNFAKASLVGVAALGTLAAAGIQASAAAEDAAATSRKLTSVLKNMGKAGAAESVEDYASALSRTTGVDDDVIKGGQTILATFSEIAKSAGQVGGVFERATKLSVDLAAAGFGTIESASVQLGKALQDPVKGITALNKSGVTFTAEQKKVIAALVQTGEVGKAQKIILAEVEKQVGGTADAGAKATERLKTGLGEVQESIGGLLIDLFQQEGKESFLDVAADKTFEFSDAVADFQKSDTWKGLKTDMRSFGRDVKTLAGALQSSIGYLDDLSVAISGNGLLHWLDALDDAINPLRLLANLLQEVKDLFSSIKVPSGLGSLLGGPLAGALGIDQKAMGGWSAGGATLVGERGPEIVNLPRGSNVTNAANTRKALTAGGDNLTVVFNDYGPQTSSGKKQNVDWVRKYAPRYGPTRQVMS